MLLKFKKHVWGGQATVSGGKRRLTGSKGLRSLGVSVYVK